MLAALAIATRLSSPGPVLFRQRRIGRDGHGFDMLKFRSMRLAPAPDARAVAAGQNVVALPSDIAPGGVEGATTGERGSER